MKTAVLTLIAVAVAATAAITLRPKQEDTQVPLDYSDPGKKSQTYDPAEAICV